MTEQLGVHGGARIGAARRASGAAYATRGLAATPRVGAPRRTRPPASRRGAAACAALLALAAACRIYREEAPPQDAPPDGTASAGAAEAPPARRESDDGRKAGANDALNLWVLNRPEGDLAPYAAERPESPGAARPVERPRAMVLVALGLGGAGADCAEQLAEREVTALGAGAAPLSVVGRVIDAAWRARWASTPGELSATVKGPRGVFGGVELAPSAALGAALEHALERHVVLDGHHPRWRAVAAAPAASLPEGCGGLAGELSGPSGVLVRTARGEFFGAVVSLAPPADAGVVSLAAQYGVSLAVGSAGAVLLATDCEVPPDERLAARVYASPSWARATADSAPPSSCRAANAVATRDRTWASPGSDLVWSAAEAEPEPEPRSSPDAPDAGPPPPAPVPS